MNYVLAKDKMAGIMANEALREGQGRFLLPPCPTEEARARADKLRELLDDRFVLTNTKTGEVIFGPWASTRILVRRSHSPAVSELEGDGNGALKIGVRMKLELRTYLELLLPPDHPKAGIWTGISPRDLEWGKSTRTVLSDKKETMSREGLFPRGRRPV